MDSNLRRNHSQCDNQVLRAVARAKLNLTLSVVGRRADGYHILDSLVAFPDIGDEIAVQKADKVSLKIKGKFANGLKGHDNSILRVVRKLQELYGDFGVSIELNKTLPVASGIGGGSSDAATMFNCLSQLFNRPIPSVPVQLEIGADVPVCISQKFQRMKGIGEDLTKLVTPPKLFVVLINMGNPLQTSKVFSALKHISGETLDDMPLFSNIDTLIDYLLKYGNDLQKVAIKVRPEIQQVLTAISKTSGCLISRMSGSGGTCFGLYSTKGEAQNAKKELAEFFPYAWVKWAGLFSKRSGNSIVG